MLDSHEELREKLKSLTSEKTRTEVYKAELRVEFIHATIKLLCALCHNPGNKGNSLGKMRHISCLTKPPSPRFLIPRLSYFSQLPLPAARCHVTRFSRSVRDLSQFSAQPWCLSAPSLILCLPATQESLKPSLFKQIRMRPHCSNTLLSFFDLVYFLCDPFRFYFFDHSNTLTGVHRC